MNGRSRAGKPRFSISCVCLLVAGIAPQVMRADVVYLTNGRSMEGVVLDETPEQVFLQLPFGEIGLPRSGVLRIERGRSALGEYMGRCQELERRPGRAAEWLELALWAEREGLGHSAREATLIAARLDPGLAGLIPLMTAMGYEYEENLAIWIPHDELMRRRGYVSSNGRWLSPSQAAALERAQDAAVAAERERQSQDRLARVVEMMVLAQMAQAEESRRLREEATFVRGGIPLWGGYPIIVSPGYWPQPSRHPKSDRHGHGKWSGRADPGARYAYRDAFLSRPPGSFIPVTPAKSHHGGLQKPSGSQ